MDRVEQFIIENGPEGHELNWDELVDQFGFNITGQTLRIRMSERSVYTFNPVKKPWVHEKLAKLRVEWAQTMLDLYPTPKDWHHVRFSDEVHFGWGPAGHSLIIRHRGSGWRQHPDCIKRYETKVKDKSIIVEHSKRLHYWAAIGYNFKSALVPYEVPGNSNGKMSQAVYIDTILKEHVAPWCKELGPWCLEEDNDSGHGTKNQTNRVARWFEARGVVKNGTGRFSRYANCPQSPDLAPIEDAWQYPKRYVKKRPHWTDEIVEELAQEAWDGINQNWINALVKSMPQRLQDVIASNGLMVEMRR